ncbi:hypothetical protein I7648_09585 [Collinsella tanakaei]|nr:hypothetical protein [Collinsella tanakaei]
MTPWFVKRDSIAIKARQIWPKRTDPTLGVFSVSSQFDENRIVATCESPFQLFALVAMYLGGLFSRCRSVLVLMGRQVNAKDEQIQATAKLLCDSRVVWLDEQYDDVKHLGLSVIGKTLFPTEAIRRRQAYLRQLANGEEFDILLCASATPLVIDVKRALCRRASASLYDDGTGTHNGAVAASLAFFDEILSSSAYQNMGRTARMKRLCKWLANRMTGGNLKLGITSVFMFNPGPENGNLYENVEISAIPSVDKSTAASKRLMLSLGPIRDIYFDNNIVLLSLPDDVGQEALAIEETTWSILEGTPKLRVIVRPHPRSGRYSGCHRSDGGAGIWEMLCLAHLVNENSILVGFGSSAQMNPKLLFDIEPTVIFLHRMLESDSDLKANAEITWSLLKRRYANPDKVLAPKSLNELTEAVRELSNSTN